MSRGEAPSLGEPAGGGPLERLIEAQLGEARRAYARIATVYDLLDGIYERSWKRRLRAELFAHARPGRLLDVGVGTGCNMPFYPPGAAAVGIDASAAMLARARLRARRLGLAVELHEAGLLALPFPDGAFDTVAATFVLLCLPDALQLAALRELSRVTRPGGRILILDYHRSSRSAVRFWMRLLSGWLRWAFAARFDPATEQHLAAAGLRVLVHAPRMGDAVTLLVLEPGPEP